jgi:hypothetical protein
MKLVHWLVQNKSGNSMMHSWMSFMGHIGYRQLFQHQANDMDDKTKRLLDTAKALVDSVSFDENGALIGGKWVGGHGGLLSQETHTKADACRRAIQDLEKLDDEPRI